MQNKKKNKQTFKIILGVIIIIALIVIAIVAINVYNKSTDDNANNSNENILRGTFRYNEQIKYEFNKNGKGAMYDGNTKYEYTYTIQNAEINIDFKDENIYDANYTYTLKDNILTLVGGKGTIGGEYILKKEAN